MVDFRLSYLWELPIVRNLTILTSNVNCNLITARMPESLQLDPKIQRISKYIKEIVFDTFFNNV